MHAIPLERVQHSGLKRILAELYNLHELGHPADLDTVEGDLRARIHHQAGPVGDHRQPGLGGELAAELHEDQHDGDDHDR